MSQTPDPPTLNYRPPPRALIPEKSAAERRWMYLRFMFWGALGVIFYVVGWAVGPNVILFRQLTRLRVEELAPDIQRTCVPVVQAAFAYERDHGELPTDVKQLVPAYLPKTGDWGGAFGGGEFDGWISHGSSESAFVRYELRPGNDRWEVMGHFVRGDVRVPVPIPAAAQSRAATQP